MQPQKNPSPLSSSLGDAGARQAPPAAGRSPLRSGLLIACVILLAGACWLAWRSMSPQKAGGGGGAAIRTAAVTVGPLERTIRLTGTTSAEKYASLVSPQLRGGRGGNVSVSVTRGAGAVAVMVQSSGGGGGGGRSDSSGGSSAASSSSASSTSSAASTASSSGSGSTSSGGTATAFRSTSNRFGTSTASASSSSSSSSRTSTSASSSSSSASSGSGGGGDRMSGGSGDFMQVIQKIAKPGSQVRKGDVVAEFDTQYQIQRLDDNKATVEQNERTMKTMDAQIDVQRKAYEFSLQQARAAVDKAKLDIRTTPVRSANDAELLRLNLEEAEANLKQVQMQIPYQEISLKASRRDTEIGVNQSLVELKQAERNVEKLSIKAPMDGMLVMENIMRGSEFQQIQQGDQVFPGQMFARVVDPSSMLVTATVNQADVESVRVGAKATLKFDAYPGLELPAHVTSIAAITSQGGARASYYKEIPVFLKIDKMDSRVIPDLSVSVDVVVDSVAGAMLAPLESVFHDGGSAKPYVYVKTASGFARREVELGLKNNIRATVTAGLKAGEVVALEAPATKSGGEGEQGQAGLTRKDLMRKETMREPGEALPGRQRRIGVLDV